MGFPYTLRRIFGTATLRNCVIFCFVHKGVFEQNCDILPKQTKTKSFESNNFVKGINFALEKYNRIVSQIQLQGLQNNISSRQLPCTAPEAVRKSPVRSFAKLQNL